MDKGTKKKENHNIEIIKRLIAKYGVSRSFVYQSLKGERNSETSDSIRKDYGIMDKAIHDLLEKL